MKTDKAMHHTHEAGLAGWISSNDVTLLTMVLVVMIALFLQSKLVKGSKEAAALLDEKITLAERLQSVQADLESTGTRLQDAQGRWRLSEEKRSELDNELRAALSKIVDLDQRLKALTASKLEVEEQKQAIVETAKRLTTERDQLARDQKRLAAVSDVLVKDKASLTEQLTQIADQLGAKLRLLEDAENERDRLRRQADELESIVASLKGKLDISKQDLEAAKEKTKLINSENATRVRALEDKVAATSALRDDDLIKLRRASEALQRLATEKRDIELRLDQVERQGQLASLREAQLSRELVGLKGKLNRAAILFDASGSMKAPAIDGQSNRWAEAQQIATTWLQHLDVEECVLIVFSSDVQTYPSDGSFARLRGKQGERERAALLEHLKKIEPKGWTNTLGALRKAYEYPQLDTVILFSDGAPTNVNLGRFDAEAAKAIYQLCRQHANIPINTVGLGNYFERDLSLFLRTVASITGGAFQGR